MVARVLKCSGPDWFVMHLAAPASSFKRGPRRRSCPRHRIGCAPLAYTFFEALTTLGSDRLRDPLLAAEGMPRGRSKSRGYDRRPESRRPGCGAKEVISTE
jgi:hypothetical protein